MLCGLVTEIFHDVASFDQRQALGDEAFELDGADFGTVLLALAAPLRLFIAVELALDPCRGAVEQVDRRPQEIIEVRFEPGVAQAHDQRVEDVGDGACDQPTFGQWPWIRFVLERTVAVELQFGDRVVGGERKRCRRGRSSWRCSLIGSAAPIAAFMATKGGGRTGPAPRKRAAGAKRRMAARGYFASRCKARRRPMDHVSSYSAARGGK